MSDSLQDTRLDADQSESVFTIHASSELMLAITNDILDLSKIEAGKIELEAVPVDVCALVQSLVRGNNSWASAKGVSVVGIVDPALAQYNFIYADPTRLNQLLTNLLTNGQTEGA
jgi:signal transduction histidine kinase